MDVRAILKDALAQSYDLPESFSFSPPEDPSMGDLSTSFAFTLAKKERCSPHLMAQDLATKLQGHPDVQPLVEKVVAQGGYVNVFLRPLVWQEILLEILRQQHNYGHQTRMRCEKVNVEYVSANPTGPLHAAHARVALMGDVIANLLKALGYEVVREFYMNDAGVQIDTLIQSISCHIKALSEGKQAIIPAGCYPGTYLEDLAREFLAQGQDLTNLKALTLSAMMEDIQRDMESLGIFHDVFTSERALHQAGQLESMLQRLQEKELAMIGVLPPPQGQEDNHWKPEPLLLFRSSLFGDEQDRPLQRADGSWTYFAGDLAYHWDKIKRGYGILIDVWGADHASHVERMQYALKALTGKDLEVVICQMVHFSDQGVPLKMSKRAGTFLTLRDVLALIGVDALRFMLLTKKAESHLNLDIERMKEQTKDNPVFYVNYAYARCCSVLRAASSYFSPKELTPLALREQANLSLLDDFSLVKILSEWPHQLQQAAVLREPHRIPTFLMRLAHGFHAVWQKGNAEGSMRFLQSDNLAQTYANLALLQAVAFVLESGFNLLGVTLKKEM